MSDERFLEIILSCYLANEVKHIKIIMPSIQQFRLTYYCVFFKSLRSKHSYNVVIIGKYKVVLPTLSICEIFVLNKIKIKLPLYVT